MILEGINNDSVIKNLICFIHCNHIIAIKEDHKADACHKYNFINVLRFKTIRLLVIHCLREQFRRKAANELVFHR